MMHPDQKFLVTVAAMNTSEDCDCVVSSSFVSDASFESVAKVTELAKHLAAQLANVPVEGMRPMTLDEIQTYRADEKAARDAAEDTLTVNLMQSGD